MLARLALAATVLLLAAPSAADAATRYAAPGASGPEPCAEIDRCDIEVAVEQASPGDTAVVAPGD